MTAVCVAKLRETNTFIVIGNILVFFMLFNLLPFDRSVVSGLCILVFIAIFWLTEAIPISITALLVPVLAILMKVLPTKEALNDFSNPIIFLFLGGFALAGALRKHGLDQAIANKILYLVKGHMAYAIVMLFVVTAMLSMWISNTATAAMMLPLALGMLTKVDVKEERNTYVFVLLGVAYCASIGGIATLVGSPPNAIAAAQVGLSFSDWIVLGLPVSLTLIPLVIFLLFYLFKPNVTHTFDFDYKPVVWDSGKLLTVFIFLLTVVLWIFSKPINGFLGGISKFDTWVALLAIVLLGMTRAVNWKDIEKSTDWGVLLLFGGGICLSHILSVTGTSTFLAEQLSYVLASMGHLAVLAMVVTFVIILTEFASNVATAALLVPLFASLAHSLGMSPVVMSMIIGVSASCAFMLPVATPPNAIVYGTGLIKQREMMRAGIYLNAVSIVVITFMARIFE